MALVLLAVASSALGSGREIIADFNQNGVVTGCYSRADFRDAIDQLRNDERDYSVAVEVIREAQATNTADADGNCVGAQTAPDEGVDDSDTSTGLWIGLIAVIIVLAVAAGVWARRGGRGDDADYGDGEDDGGDDPTQVRSDADADRG